MLDGLVLLFQVTAANILDIPVVATEQYPKGTHTITCSLWYITG